jgi:hypothetical protein
VARAHVNRIAARRVAALLRTGTADVLILEARMTEHDDRMLRMGRLLQQLSEMQRQMDTVMKVVHDLQREARLSAQLTKAAVASVRKDTRRAPGRTSAKKRKRKTKES